MEISIEQLNSLLEVAKQDFFFFCRLMFAKKNINKISLFKYSPNVDKKKKEHEEDKTK